MCLKEFYGYNCGHCSVPTLVRCPIAEQDSNYPPCQFPGERPIYVDGFCHPCSRVAWNKEVLRVEEAHRRRHQSGECECEVIFDQEERERRSKQLSLMGKARAWEESHGSGSGRRYFDGKNHGGRGGRGGFGERIESGREVQQWGGGRDCMSGTPRAGHYRRSTRGEYNPLSRGDRNTERGQFPGSETFQDSYAQNSTRQNWSAGAKLQAYQHAGYGADDNQGHRYGSPAHIHPMGGQMSQPGAGMKWYQEEPPMPSHLQFPSLPKPLSEPDSLAYQNPINTRLGYPANTSNTANRIPITQTGSPYQIPVTRTGSPYPKNWSEPPSICGSAARSSGSAAGNESVVTDSYDQIGASGGPDSQHATTNDGPKISANLASSTNSTEKIENDDDNRNALQSLSISRSNPDKGSTTGATS